MPENEEVGKFIRGAWVPDLPKIEKVLKYTLIHASGIKDEPACALEFSRIERLAVRMGVSPIDYTVEPRFSYIVIETPSGDYDIIEIIFRAIERLQEGGA